MSGVADNLVDEVKGFQMWLSTHKSLKSQPIASQVANYMSLVGGMLPLTAISPLFNTSLSGLIRGVAESLMQQIVPSGFVHLCFMFGPLIIESGTEK